MPEISSILIEVSPSKLTLQTGGNFLYSFHFVLLSLSLAVLICTCIYRTFLRTNVHIHVSIVPSYELPVHVSIVLS